MLGEACCTESCESAPYDLRPGMCSCTECKVLVLLKLEFWGKTRKWKCSPSLSSPAASVRLRRLRHRFVRRLPLSTPSPCLATRLCSSHGSDKDRNKKAGEDTQWEGALPRVSRPAERLAQGEGVKEQVEPYRYCVGLQTTGAASDRLSLHQSALLSAPCAYCS